MGLAGQFVWLDINSVHSPAPCPDPLPVIPEGASYPAAAIA